MYALSCLDPKHRIPGDPRGSVTVLFIGKLFINCYYSRPGVQIIYIYMGSFMSELSKSRFSATPATFTNKKPIN